MPLVLQSVSKRYGRTDALQRVSLEVRDGEFVTLLGPSGCGKTTLLRIVAGFVEPDSGKALLGEDDLFSLPVNRRPVGIVFQNYALFPHLTVFANVAFGLRVRGASTAKVAETVERMLELVSLTEFRDRYPGQLSGGQQQRVALARTLAIEPRVLLLDEPLAALDRKLRVQMQEDLRKLVTRLGITTIFVTHDQEEALNMSDRIALMDRGTVVQYDTPMNIYDRPVSVFAAVFVGNSNLLPGALRTADDGTTWLEVGKLRIPLQTSPAGGRSTATALIRPESVRIDAAPRNPEAVGGTVSYVMPLGSATSYEVVLETGHEIKVEAARGRNEGILQRGDRVYVSFDAESAYLIPEGQP